MERSLLLVEVDSKYCNYLRKYDSKVSYNYGEKAHRPYVGVLFNIGSCMYFAPLSSPKPKHLKLKTKVDFIKIDNGRLGAINFNNMIPVTENNIKIINLRKLMDNKKDILYMKMLNKQIYWLNRHKAIIYRKSEKLYNMFVNNLLPDNIAKRCCDFKLLEEKCLLYNKK